MYKIHTNISGMWNKLVPRHEKEKPILPFRLLAWEP